jgi:hypothetical protein
VRHNNVLAMFALVATAGAGFGWDARGIPARPSRQNYPITCFTDKIAVGAMLLTPEKVRATFGPDVERRYVVVEVGVYPKLACARLRYRN